MNDQNYDLRQYRLLRQIVDIRPTTIHQISDFLESITAILHVLRNADKEWQRSIDKNYWDIEIIFAVALDEQRKEFNELEINIINNAYNNIKSLVENKLYEVEKKYPIDEEDI